jgi:hypothetical protein
LPLELWDSSRSKWILYRNQQQHSDDCAAYPFEQIPRRVFLDTNIINVLVKLRNQVFEQEQIPNTVESTLALDAEALMHVFYVGSRAGWDILASAKTIDEISRTRNLQVRDELLDYAVQVVDQNSEGGIFAATFGRRLIDTHLVSALPDRADRELIGNAIGAVTYFAHATELQSSANAINCGDCHSES